MAQERKRRTLAEAASLVKDGDVVALGGRDGQRHPMALVVELVRQGRRGLHLLSLGGGIDVDLLVGAGCVAAVETASARLAGIGPAPNIDRVRGGLALSEVTAAMMLDRFRAGAEGLPFLPHEPGPALGEPSAKPDMAEIRDPFSGAPWTVVRAADPDVALVHAHAGDVFGTIQFDRGTGPECASDSMIARSAKTVIVSVEQIVSSRSLAMRPTETLLSAEEVTCVACAPYGAHPCGLDPRYRYDREHLEAFLAAARAGALDGWVRTLVREPRDHAAYLGIIGSRRLMELSGERRVT